MSSTAEIAVEVDRLVIGVHRAVMARHQTELRDSFDAIEFDSPGYFYDLAEFVAAGACTVEIARQRCRYEPDDVGATMVDELRQRQLLDSRFRPRPDLLHVVDVIHASRAESAARLWQSDLREALEGSAEALAGASGLLTSGFRSLPEPTAPAHRLHHLLTGVRYGRFDAHVTAWENVGLTASEIVALDTATRSKPVSPVPQGLVSKGWLTGDGTITVQGQEARSAVEAATNIRCDNMLSGLTDREGWFAALRALPPMAE